MMIVHLKKNIIVWKRTFLQASTAPCSSCRCSRDAQPARGGQGNAGLPATHCPPQRGTVTLEHNRATDNPTAGRLSQNSNENKTEEEKGSTWRDPVPTRQDSGQMKGEERKKKKEKGNRNRGQREKSVRGNAMPETVPGPGGWMPTQKPPKSSGYRAPKTFLIKKKKKAVQVEICQAVPVLAVPAPPLSPRRSQPEIVLWRGDPRHPVTLASYPLGNMHPLKHLCISESV